MHRVIAAVVLFAALALAAPAAATPVATSDQSYGLLGRVFPDPLAGCMLPACSPNAKGNLPATQFIGLDEFVDGLRYMSSKPWWARRMEVLVLDGKLGDGALTRADVEAGPGRMFPGNNLAKLEYDPRPEYVSAGLPTTTLARQKSDLLVVRVTDETVPDKGKQRYTLSLSIHGIERAGAEGGTRAMEDIVTAFETGIAGQPVVPAAVRAGAPTFADVLRKTIVYFTYPNPDGWRRGSVSQGGVFFQRYNGNGIDPNRDWPDIGFAFRPYSGASEPETKAFLGFYDGVRARGPFAAGDDLHGQPGADALSYTLLPHGRHDLGKDTRIREAAKTINRSTYEAVKWSPYVKPNDPVSDPSSNPDACASDVPIFSYCTRIYGQTWGSVYDTINYTTTGTLGDWFDSGLGLRADGIDNEMSFSHLDKNIVFEPHTEQLHVDGNKALIYAHLTDMLAPSTASMDPPGRQGYVANTRLRRDEQVLQEPAPKRTVPQDDIAGATGTPGAEGTAIPFTVLRTAPSRNQPGIYSGGMRVDVTVPNVQGISSGSAVLQVQCRHCDDHVGAGDAESDEWITVAEDYNQSPIYAQAGLTVAVNRPDANYTGSDGKQHPVDWRALVALPAGVTSGPARMDIDFTSGPATTDGNTEGDPPPLLRAYDVANTDFFADLDPFIADATERFKKVDPRLVIDGTASLAGLRTLVLADELLPGYTGDYAGERTPAGPPTADRQIEDTKPTTPSQGPTGCVRSDASTDRHDFTIGADDGNGAVTVRIEWASELNDWDLFLQRRNAAGSYVDVKDAQSSLTSAEQVELEQPPAGDYRVEVVNCTALDTNYTGSISFTPLPPRPDSAYTAAEKDAWVTALDAWVRGGGTLVLTDGALRGLTELTAVPRSAVAPATVYTGQVTFRRCTAYAADGTCASDERTLTDPLARNVNQPGSRFNTGLRRQVFEPTPLGFAIQDAGGGDASFARQWDVDDRAFRAAGGRVAATSADSGARDAQPVLERVTIGEIALGTGRLRIAGALLPQPSTAYDHPLGLEPYALTYTGYILACNLLDADCATR